MQILLTLWNLIEKFIQKKIYAFKKQIYIRFKKVKPLILFMGTLLLISGFLFSFNCNFLFKKTYDNKLSFVEVNTNQKARNTNVAKVSLQSNPSWAWPVEGANCYISQYFHSGHRALDIAGCGHGSNIHAAHNGIVVTAGYKSTNGNYIVLRQDNGYHTMYAHLSQIYVSVNQRVAKDSVIGAMGSTGYSTGPHLHFSVWQNGYPYEGGYEVNPFNFY